jgi:DNA-binding beta-propeller fold protein YncE
MTHALLRLAAMLAMLPAGAGAAAPPDSGGAAAAAPPDGGGGSVRFVARLEISLFADADAPGFRQPEAVSTDVLGDVFVADTGNHRVVQFDPDGRRVFELGGYGWGEGELSRPTDVCAREGFRLFVVDAGNERIQQFDIRDRTPEGTVFPFQEGQGLLGEELVRPRHMDLDAEGRVYVSDELCHCVWIFTPTGQLAMQLGGLGDAPTRFRSPAGVAVGRKGRVYVVDAGNRRVQVFDSIGNYLGAWGGPKQDVLVEPAGIDVAEDGGVWVADVGAASVRLFTPDGIEVFSFGGEGDGPGRFRAPVDVAAGPRGRVWVVDRERGTVEGYRIERTAAPGR